MEDSAYLSGIKGADERTRTADLLITSDQSGLLSFLCLALCCTVLRSRWYQSGINRAIAFHYPPHSRIHPQYVQHLAEHASIQLTVDRYSHWIPSMGRNTADGMDEALR